MIPHPAAARRAAGLEKRGRVLYNTRHGRTIAAIVPISYLHRLEAYKREERMREGEAKGLSVQEIIAQEMADELDTLDE